MRNGAAAVAVIVLASVGCERDRSPATPQPTASRPRVVDPAPAACAGHEAEASVLEGDRWRLSCADGQPLFETEGADDRAPTREALTEAQWNAAWARVEQTGWRGLYECPQMDQCGAHSEPMETGEYSIVVTVPEGQRRFRCEMSCGERSAPHAAVMDAIRFAAPGQPTPFTDGGSEPAVADPGAPGTAKRCGEDWGVHLEVSGKHGAWSATVGCASGRALRWDRWDRTPDTHAATGPDSVADADWDALWTAVEQSGWRTALDCRGDGGSPYDGWSLTITDGAGHRTFRGKGSRFALTGQCASIVRAVDATIASPNNRW